MFVITKMNQLLILALIVKIVRIKTIVGRKFPNIIFFLCSLEKKRRKYFFKIKVWQFEDLAKTDYPNGNKKIDLISYLNKETFIDRNKISTFFKFAVISTIFWIFETFSPAIPIFENTKPYEAIPFQFSLHIKRNIGSELEHHEYLHQTRDDPRTMFTKKLLNVCEKVGTIIVYNQSFEMNIIKLLAKNFPEKSTSLLNFK